MPYAAPENLIAALAIFLLMAEAFFNLRAKTVGLFVLIGLILTIFFTIGLKYHEAIPTYWSGLYVWDPAAKFFKIFFLVSTALVTWMSLETASKIQDQRAEFYIIPLFATAGMLLLASAAGFMVLFVALELVTISFYILVAYQMNNLLSLEAGVKYLILGALASAFLVMGIAYVFGLTGSTRFSDIFLSLSSPEGGVGIGFGLILILIGIAFKISAVPFHFWAPDVYQGAPTPITAFLSTASKAAGFIILIRVFVQAFGAGNGPFVGVFMLVLKTLAICSLILGNVAAFPQRNLKRLLAYSSIGHSGYILIAVLALRQTPAGLVAVGIYLISYLLASITAFSVIALVNDQLLGQEIHHYAGLWKRSPLAALALAVALISLAGLPPMIGFIGKLAIFTVAWDAQLYPLFWIGLATSVAGLYYYLNVVKMMFWSAPVDTDPVAISASAKFVLGLLTFLILALGLWPGGLVFLVRSLG